MTRPYRMVFVFSIIIHCYTSVNCEKVFHHPTIIDKVIDDYFEAADQFWISIGKREENVLANVAKRFTQIDLNGEDEISLMINVENIGSGTNDYGDKVSKITSGLRYGIYQTRVKTSSEFYDKLSELRNTTTLLYDIVSLDKFWKAAHETASASPYDSYYRIPPQQMLLKYYYCIQMAQLKSFLGFHQLYMTASIEFTSENLDYNSLKTQLNEEFQAKFATVRNAAKKYFQSASRSLLLCRPSSYTTVTNFLQGIVDNEVNLNPERSCGSQCSDYKQTKHFQCETGSLCDSHEGRKPNVRCNGTIRDCVEIDTSDVVLCLNHHESTRRYNGIKINNKLVAGQDVGSCQIKAASWMSGFYRCTNCYCLCDDPSISERHFSLRDVVSDIQQNKVITDVRMNKVNGIIQFQIKERILLPFAVADIRDNVLTVDGWQTAPLFSVTDTNATKDVDFFELSYDKRSISLDDIRLPKHQLLTGVRFCVKNGHLTIEGRGTNFDYVTGTLKDIDESTWISNAKGRNEISIGTQGLPNDNDRYYEIGVSNVPDAFIKFGPAGYSQDIGQTTIPYIETTSEKAKYYAPLGGVGLYYKSTEYSTGYIATKTIAYDIGLHF